MRSIYHPPQVDIISKIYHPFRQGTDIIEKKSCSFEQDFFLAPQVGLEPTTLRLTAACSTDWAIEECKEKIICGSQWWKRTGTTKNKMSWKAGETPNLSVIYVGTALSSQAVASQVFSTLMSLTSVFGMGTGGPSSPLAPTIQSRYSENWIKGKECGEKDIKPVGQALDRLVLASLTRHRAYTLSLSTS